MSNLRDVPRGRPHRDPSGKAALFSRATAAAPTEVATAPEPVVDLPPAGDPVGERRPGTLVIECGDCGANTRVTWMDFALLNLPLSLWLPLPGRRHNRLMTCPACRRSAWVRARWTA